MYQHVGGGGLLDGRGRYISYLEIEERNGEAYQWLESHEIGVPSDLVRRRLVLHGAPWKPAIAEITQYTFSSPGSAPRPWAEPKKLRTVSSEPITVAAGTFLADVIEYERRGVLYRDYISRDEPRGLILRETPGHRYELIAWGSDAETKIVERDGREEVPGLGSIVTFSGTGQAAERRTPEEEAAQQWRHCVGDHATRLVMYDGAGMESVWDVATERCAAWEPDTSSWPEIREESLDDTKATGQELWRKTSTVELTEDTCQEKPSWLLLQRCQEILNGE